MINKLTFIVILLIKFNKKKKKRFTLQYILFNNNLTSERLIRLRILITDKISFDIYQIILEKIQQMIKHEMENTFQFDVPLVVDLGMGKTGWKRIKKQ